MLTEPKKWNGAAWRDVLNASHSAHNQFRDRFGSRERVYQLRIMIRNDYSYVWWHFCFQTPNPAAWVPNENQQMTSSVAHVTYHNISPHQNIQQPWTYTVRESTKSSISQCYVQTSNPVVNTIPVQAGAALPLNLQYPPLAGSFPQQDPAYSLMVSWCQPDLWDGYYL